MKITKAQLKQIIKEELEAVMSEQLPDYALGMMRTIGSQHSDAKTQLKKAVSNFPDIQKVIKKYPEIADKGFHKAAINYRGGPYREEMNLKDAYESLLYGFNDVLDDARLDPELADELWEKWQKSTGMRE